MSKNTKNPIAPGWIMFWSIIAFPFLLGGIVYLALLWIVPFIIFGGICGLIIWRLVRNVKLRGIKRNSKIDVTPITKQASTTSAIESHARAKVITCNRCGANSAAIAGQIKQCEYCDSLIEL